MLNQPKSGGCSCDPLAATLTDFVGPCAPITILGDPFYFLMSGAVLDGGYDLTPTAPDEWAFTASYLFTAGQAYEGAGCAGSSSSVSGYDVDFVVTKSGSTYTITGTDIFGNAVFSGSGPATGIANTLSDGTITIG